MFAYVVTQYRRSTDLDLDFQRIERALARVEGGIRANAATIQALQIRVGGLDRAVIGELVPEITRNEARTTATEQSVRLPAWYTNREQEIRRRLMALETWRFQVGGSCP